MAAAALLRRTAQPTDADIDAAMSNICRCGTYQRSGRDPSRGKGGLMQRRDFLQITGTIGAGLVIGFRIPDRRGVRRCAQPWARIGTDDGVCWS